MTKKGQSCQSCNIYNRLMDFDETWQGLTTHGYSQVLFFYYYTTPFGFSLFRHFWGSLVNILNYFVWLRITDEGSVPEMRIWFILLIGSD